jgi:hypothetical protein
MTVKVDVWLQNNGDGSSSIVWVRERDRALWSEYVDMYFDYYNDGDGETLRDTLIFESYEAAEAVGIRFRNLTDEDLE